VINGTNIEFTPTANFNGTASFDYTVEDNGQTNGSNNFKTDTGSVSFAVSDTTNPTASVAIAATALSDTTNSTTVTITFTEAPTGFDAGTDLSVVGGTLSNASLVGNVWTATYTATDGFSGTGSVTLANDLYTDAALNLGSGGSDTVTVDRSNPTATITSDKASLIVGETATLTITFSEAVNGFTKDDLSVESGTLGTLSGPSAGPNGTVIYTIGYTPATSTVDAAMNVSLANTYTDIVGNTGNAANASINVNTTSATREADNLITVNFSGNSNTPTSTISGLNFSDPNGPVTIVRTEWFVENATTAYQTINGSSLSMTLSRANDKGNFFVRITVSDGTETTQFTSGIFGINNNTGSVTGVSIGVSLAPVALDLDGDGVEYLGLSAGVTYDYDKDGRAELTAWVDKDDGLLAELQSDGSYKIVFSTHEGESDLEGLAKIYDSNGDGVLDVADSQFGNFGVWQDTDSDGVVDTGEFRTLTAAGIVGLGLVSDGLASSASNGEVQIVGNTTYTMADGTVGLAQDVMFLTTELLDSSSGLDTQVFVQGENTPVISGLGASAYLSGYDVISDFAADGSQELGSLLSLPGDAFVVADTGVVEGQNSGIDLGLDIFSYKIFNGLATFFSDTQGHNPICLDSENKIAAVVDYLAHNDLGEAGATVAFKTELDGVVDTYVYCQIDTGGNASASYSHTLTQLTGVNASGLTSEGGLQLNYVHVD
jgi:hypothetical protein